MTIQTTYTPSTYYGDGVSTVFNILFPYQLATDISVATIVVATNVTTTLVQGTNYTVSPTNNSPAAVGAITLIGGALPVGTTLTISRATPVTQLTHWVPNNPNPSTATENGLDKLTMILQNINFQNSRSIFLRPFDTDGSGEFDARGNGIINLAAATVGSEAVTLSQMQTYISNIISLGSAYAPTSFSFTGNGVTTSFPITGSTIAAPSGYIVNINGVTQNPGTDYSINLNTIPPTLVFTQAPPGAVGVSPATNIQVLVLGFAAPIGGTGTGLDASVIVSGVLNPARLGSGTGTSANFLRGDQTWSNTLIGSLGTNGVANDTQSIFTAQQAGISAIRVIGGAGTQGSLRMGTADSGNPWDMGWNYIPSVGVTLSSYAGGSGQTIFYQTGDVNFGYTGFYFSNSANSVGINTTTPLYPLHVAGTVYALNYLGNAAGSLITSGQVLPQFLASNAPLSGTFLRSDGTWAILPTSGGGSGGYNTTTTASFTVASIGSSQTFPVVTTTGIAAGNYVSISDGVAHTVSGQVSAVAGLNLTVTTQNIIAGGSGATMPSGAAVQINPLSSQLVVTGGAFGATPINEIDFRQNPSGTISSANVDVIISSFIGAAAQVLGNTNRGLTLGSIYYSPYPSSAPSYDSIAVNLQGQQTFSGLRSGAAGTFLSSNGTNLSFITIPPVSPTNVSTVPYINATNTPSAGQVLSYGSASQFTWINQPVPTGGTSGTFLRGDNVWSNTLLNYLFATSNIGANDATPISTGTIQSGLMSVGNDGTNQYATWLQYNAGALTYNRYFIAVGSLAIGNTALQPKTAGVQIGTAGAESLYAAAGIRSNTFMRALSGFWNQYITVSGAPNNYPIDIGVGAYIRCNSFANNVTFQLTDSVNVPTTSGYQFETELTVEIVAPGSYTVAFAYGGGSINWLTGSQPAVSTTGTTVYKFIRRQNLTDIIAYAVPNSTSAYSDTQARSAVLQAAYLVNSSSVGWTISAGTSATPFIQAGGVTAAMLAGNIPASALLGYPGTTTTFLRGDGTWVAPPGGSGTSIQVQSSAVNVGTAGQYTNWNFGANSGVLAGGLTAAQTSSTTVALGLNSTIVQPTLTFTSGGSPINSGLAATTIALGTNLTGTFSSGILTINASGGGGGGGSFSPATSYNWTAPQTFNGRQIFTSNGFPATSPFSTINATAQVMINDYNNGGDQMFPDGATGLKIASTNNDSGGNFHSFIVNQTNTIVGAGGASSIRQTNRNSVKSGSFALALTVIAETNSLGGTVTTASFTIAAVNSSQTVQVASSAGITVNSTVQISDSTPHAITGKVTAVSGGTLTVQTITISSGSAGNTMASGASCTNAIGGSSDALWLNSWSPAIQYAPTSTVGGGGQTDATGYQHSFANGGFVRIGECNYGNAWKDFGFVDQRQYVSSVGGAVCGLEFFPYWGGSDITGSTTAHSFNAQWAIAIGPSGVDPYGFYAKQWTGILIDGDSIVPVNGATKGGMGINLHGGTTSGGQIQVGLNIQGYMTTGINFAGSFSSTGGSPTGGGGGGAAVISTDASGQQPAIIMAQGQAVCFKPSTGAGTGVYIYFDGTNLKCYKNGTLSTLA